MSRKMHQNTHTDKIDTMKNDDNKNNKENK